MFRARKYKWRYIFLCILDKCLVKASNWCETQIIWGWKHLFGELQLGRWWRWWRWWGGMVMFKPVPEWIPVCSAPGRATVHLTWNFCDSFLYWNTNIFSSSFSLGPEVPIPAMRLEENKVNVARSHLSDMPPRSVPAVHLSEMVLCVSLKATILCASMNDSIYLALLLDQVLWHRWQRR